MTTRYSSIRFLLRSLPFAIVALVLGAGVASAQALAMADRDDSRSETELRVEMREAVDRDTDSTNTALVFNNTTNQDAIVFCTAYGANGRLLGRKIAKLPARGTRYLRASDLSNGADFVGSALCSSRARVAGSAVFLAPGAITNLDVIQAGPWDSNRIRFPLIASY